MKNISKYIEMCEKALEIQKRDVPKHSFVAVKPCSATYDYGRRTWKIIGITTSPRKSHNPYHVFMLGNPHGGIKRKDFIWLPRQDQLQDMVWRANVPFMLSVVDEFASTFFLLVTAGKRIGIKWHPETMEELWLAFVMKEKYKKSWNGKEWVHELQQKLQ